MADQLPIYIPPGRFVSGSLTEKRTKDGRNLDIMPDKQRYEFGVAIAKTSPETAAFFQALVPLIHQAFVGTPQQSAVGPVIDNWARTLDGFSGKISDGDRPAKATGKVNSNTAGHYVIWFSSNYQTSCYSMDGQPMSADAIKRGYYVDINASIAANSNVVGDGIGIYVNPQLIRFVQIGEEIRGGPDHGAMLAAMPAQIGQIPGAPAPGAAPVAPPMGAGMVQQQQQQAAPAPAPVVPNGTLPVTPPPAATSAGAPAGIPGMGTVPATEPATTAYPSNPGIMPGNGGLPGQ